jgi:hypothetical protein
MDPVRRDYRYRIRKYPARRGLTWRWWIFEGTDESHVDTGIVVSADRKIAEAAVNQAIERRQREARGSDARPPGVVGHNSPEEPVVSGRSTL